MQSCYVALFFLLTVCKTVGLNQPGIGVHNFLGELIKGRFQSCSLILVKESSSKENFAVVSQTFVSKYSVNFNLNDNFNGTLLPSFCHKHRLFASRKVSGHCAVAIVFMRYVNTNLFQQIRHIILPNFLPIMRKNEDYFIFVSHSQNHEKLLMEEISQKIKFKIAVGTKTNTGKEKGLVQVSMIDFFGGLGGSPKFTQLNVNIINVNDQDYFPDFLWDFNGGLIRFSISNTKSMIEPYKDQYLNNGKTGRFTYLVEEYLKPKFNFSYHMFISTDINGTIGGGGTGYLLENGTFVGITGDILYNRADIGLSIANTEERDKYIGFTDSHFFFGWLMFVTGQPRKVFSSQAVFKPFDQLVWASFGTCCVFGIALSVIVKKASQKLKMPQSNFEIRSLLAPLIEQDYLTVPPSITLKCFVGLWSFFAIVITNLYRSKLVSLLAFPIVDKLPETFAELAYSELQIAFMKHGDSGLNLFKVSSDPVYQTLVKKMEIITGLGLECLEKVINEEHSACIAYNFDVDYLIANNLTDADGRKFIVAPRGKTYNMWVGVATEAYSIYKPNLNKIIGYTMPFYFDYIWPQMDIYKNVHLPKREWWRETNQLEKLVPFSPDESEEDSDKLSLKHMLGVFYMMLSTLGLCLFSFIGELAHFFLLKRVCKI